jgi:tetratricopeptide (TPR) repeat protein
LEAARAGWDGAPADLAQVHNAIGFANFQVGKLDAAVDAYRAAVGAQPGYVTAWNNLGDAHEARRDWGSALAAYEEALAYDPDNRVARARAEAVRGKVGTSSF